MYFGGINLKSSNEQALLMWFLQAGVFILNLLYTVQSVMVGYVTCTIMVDECTNWFMKQDKKINLL